MAMVDEATVALLERHGVDLAVRQSLPSALHRAPAERAMKQLQVSTEHVGTVVCDACAGVSGRFVILTGQMGPAATLLDAWSDSSRAVSPAVESR